MASTLILRRRIRTAQNVSKTTKAMQMIAASKLKRAQEATLSARPYVNKLTRLSQSLAYRVDDAQKHAYMKTRNIAKKSMLVIIAPDKGLCGGLVTNLVREYAKMSGESLLIVTIGKKAEHYVGRDKNQVVASFPFGTSLPSYTMIFPIAKIIEDAYLSPQVDSVSILTTTFKSAFTQKPTLTKLLPLTLPEEAADVKHDAAMLFEPTITDLLTPLLKQYLEMSLYQELLESFLSEQAARMFAMQNATDNAKEMISALKLEYNKARQQKITSEILDISSGSMFAGAL